MFRFFAVRLGHINVNACFPYVTINKHSSLTSKIGHEGKHSFIGLTQGWQVSLISYFSPFFIPPLPPPISMVKVIESDSKKCIGVERREILSETSSSKRSSSVKICAENFILTILWRFLTTLSRFLTTLWGFCLRSLWTRFFVRLVQIVAEMKMLIQYNKTCQSLSWKLVLNI